MNHLKLVQKGWPNYTGYLSQVEFKDGISVHPVPRSQADALAALMQFVDCDADGNELGEAGLAARLVSEARERAPVAGSLVRQTEEERKAEEHRDRLNAQKAPVETFYTGAELQRVADEKGIKGLRELAEPWGIKGRAIPMMIEMILAAQAAYLEGRDKKMQELAAREKAAEEEAERIAVEAKRKASEKPVELKGVTSTRFEKIYVIGEVEYSIGDLVLGAFKDTGIDAETWNQLIAGVRDEYVEAHIKGLEFLAGQPKPVTNPTSTE